MHGIQKQCPNKYLPILENSSKVVDSQNIWKKGIRKKKQRRFYWFGTSLAIIAKNLRDWTETSPRFHHYIPTIVLLL